MTLKIADDLAARVREQGYKCECMDGHAYLVWREGQARILARFSAGEGLSHPDLAMKRAESELRRLGILPKERHEEGRKVRKSRERRAKVAAMSEAERQHTPVVVGMIRGALMDLGGDTPTNRTRLAKLVVDVLPEVGVPQFGVGGTGSGKSLPENIARVGMVNMLDKGQSAKRVTAERWEKGLLALRQNGRLGEAKQEPEPEKPVVEPEPEPELEPSPEKYREAINKLAAEVRRLKAEAESHEELLQEAADQVEATTKAANEQVAAEKNRADLLSKSLNDAREELAAAKAELATAGGVADLPDMPPSLRIAFQHGDAALALEVYELEMKVERQPRPAGRKR